VAGPPAHGPGPIAPPVPPVAFEPSLAPFVGLMALGFLVAVAGHLVGSSALVWVGLVLIFLATVVLPLVVFGNPY
jgi:hypothetical protein